MFGDVFVCLMAVGRERLQTVFRLLLGFFFEFVICKFLFSILWLVAFVRLIILVSQMKLMF